MGWINAWRIVADVKHVLIWRYWSVDKCIGDTMRAYLAVMFIADHAVAIFVSSTCPRPAFFKYAKFKALKESFAQWTSTTGVTTSLRTKRMSFPTNWKDFALLAKDMAKTLCTDTPAAAIKNCIDWIRMAVAATLWASHPITITQMGYV